MQCYVFVLNVLGNFMHRIAVETAGGNTLYFHVANFIGEYQRTQVIHAYTTGKSD